MMRGVKKTYKRLFLHTHEAHPPRNGPLRNKGESGKLFVITIIGMVLVLALLLSSQGQLTGNGFFTGEVNTAGTELVAAPVYENQPFSLKVRANTDKEISVIGFELKLPSGMNCANVQDIQNLLGWDVESEKTCDASQKKIIFEYATFGAGKSEKFDAAQIDFTGMPKGNYAFTFKSFQAFDSQNKNIIQKVLNPVVEVQSAPSPEASSSPASAGGAAPTASAEEVTPTASAKEVTPTVPVEEVTPTASAEEAASEIPAKKVSITKAAEALKAASKKLVAMGKNNFKVAWLAAAVLAVFITAIVIIVYLRRKKRKVKVQKG